MIRPIIWVFGFLLNYWLFNNSPFTSFKREHPGFSLRNSMYRSHDISEVFLRTIVSLQPLQRCQLAFQTETLLDKLTADKRFVRRGQKTHLKKCFPSRLYDSYNSFVWSNLMWILLVYCPKSSIFMGTIKMLWIGHPRGS